MNIYFFIALNFAKISTAFYKNRLFFLSPPYLHRVKMVETQDFASF